MCLCKKVQVKALSDGMNCAKFCYEEVCPYDKR